ncbi:MAG: glycine--tRNA ligase subunit beta [Firmicutes bacterium]|jgi:glycyl-tRNA synthetase beta chain|nr:glycine--tRNA ligase subunit beta [Bacillota bacterium]NLO66044.1 glycine--tRNA ligase subunit beta [Bacillota bacterium]
MQDFLLELGFEELPARFVQSTLNALSQTIQAGLEKERLAHGEVSLYGTPRRLAVLIKDLQLQQEDQVLEVKGPPKNIAYDTEGQLTKAGQGFLRSQGVEADAVFIKEFQGADYVYIKKEVKGKQTSALIKPLLEDIIANLHFPKNMRWGDYDLRFARPLRWIVCLLGEEVIPLEVGPVRADRITFGHRQLSQGPIVVSKPADYLPSLKDGYVLADMTERKELIRRQIVELAKEKNAVVTEDGDLLDEVLNLVEYPTAFCGRFAEEYLELPSEVLEMTMKSHQRYFPLEDGDGGLLPGFIGIRNGADNHLETVIAGNEKVLSARLADARFFYDEDQNTPLADNVAKLENVVFQEGLGSMGDKVARIEAISAGLTRLLGFSQHTEAILRTAKLSKADLVTQMVNEFPELQGVMGEKYALLQGEEPDVAVGIREHYLPRFAGDDLPQTPAGIVVSLADKFDTLVGYFALGKIPTGSQDPFALRRQAQGVVQILLNGQCLALGSVIDLVGAEYAKFGVQLSEEAKMELLEFFRARLRVLLLDQGYAYDLVDAVLASGEDRLSELQKRVKSLAEFRVTPQFDNLITGFDRVENLARKAEGTELNQAVMQAADQEFYQAMTEIKGRCEAKMAEGDYSGYLRALADFRAPIDRFFTDVMIMDEDLQIRSNRLALLQAALALYAAYGDFKQIVVNR